MKKLNLQLDGHPFANDELMTLQEETFTALSASFSAIGGQVIITGCNVTPNGAVSDVSTGIVFLNDKFLRFQGASGVSLPIYIVEKPTQNIIQQDAYANGTTKSVIVEEVAIHSTTQPSGVQYIAVTNDSTTRRYPGLILDPKANKAQPVWTNLTLEAGTSVYNSLTPKYFKDTLGFVHLRGAMNCNLGGNPDSYAGIILPASIRPNQSLVFPVPSELNSDPYQVSGFDNISRVRIEANGNFIVPNFNYNISIDGISYYVGL